MPVIIGQLDLIDTKPDPAADIEPPTAGAPVATLGSTIAALRVAADRAARVLAD